MKRILMKRSRCWFGFTQQQLGEKVGLTELQISQIENGRKEIAPVAAIRISEILKTKKEKLFPELFLNETEEVEK